jgi:hypothetical protein
MSFVTLRLHEAWMDVVELSVQYPPFRVLTPSCQGSLWPSRPWITLGVPRGITFAVP